MGEYDSSPDPRRRLGKDLNEEQDPQRIPDDEKASLNIDIKTREVGSTESQSNGSVGAGAPSADLINNTGADIGAPEGDADAASG